MTSGWAKVHGFLVANRAESHEGSGKAGVPLASPVPNRGTLEVGLPFPGPGRIEASGIMAETLDNCYTTWTDHGRASLTDLRARPPDLDVEMRRRGRLSFSDRGYTRNCCAPA